MIKIILISHIFLFSFYFSSNMIFFFLGYDKIDIKQNFSALGIIEPQSKEVWSLSYVTSMIDISIFRNIKIIP